MITVGQSYMNLIYLWQKLRAHYWLALGFDLLVLLALLWAIHAWQTRDLPRGEPAPATMLPLLASADMTAAIQAGHSGVVYFFAPWCGICRHSIDNLDAQVRDGHINWATVIALDYSSQAEVSEFVAETGITLPTLMGTIDTAQDWNIRAFPTYFVIDAEGNIASRSVGYSTWLGIRWRHWLASFGAG